MPRVARAARVVALPVLAFVLGGAATEVTLRTRAAVRVEREFRAARAAVEQVHLAAAAAQPSARPVTWVIVVAVPPRPVTRQRACPAVDL